MVKTSIHKLKVFPLAIHHCFVAFPTKFSTSKKVVTKLKKFSTQAFRSSKEGRGRGRFVSFLSHLFFVIPTIFIVKVPMVELRLQLMLMHRM